MIADALRDVVVASSAAGSLATWPFTTGSRTPAVFTTGAIPEGCGYPAVIIDDLPGTDWGTRAKQGGECFARIRVYGDKTWHPSAVRAVTWDIREAVNRVALDATLRSYGYACGGVWADPPGYLEDPDNFPGQVIGVRALVLQL